jgi:type II secretory pathway pseudopilin PulG
MKDFFSKKLASIATCNTQARHQPSLSAQKGITLLESLLALAIASAIIILALKSYSSMQKNESMQAINANVDFLFISMSQYYRANCGTTNYDSTGADVKAYYSGTGATLHKGTLNPVSFASNTPVPYAINLFSGSDNLVSDGYLNLNNIAYASLVDNSGGANTGYFLQFNPSTITTEQFNACAGSTSTSCMAPTAGATGTSGTAGTGTKVLIWNAQVAVAIAAPASNSLNTMIAYKNALGADCISSLSSGVVTPCNAAPTPGNYLVWSRLASDPSPKTMDSLWSYMPAVKQFNLQYTHDQFYELNNPSGTYYYLCGG